LSDLIAVAYPDRETAETVRETLGRLTTERAIELADAGGAMTDVGINDQFMRQLGEKLKPGGAALIVLVTKSTPDKMLPRIQEYGGEVLQTSLDNEAEERLREALQATASAGAAV
jgi:uncharacterized membrane protein